MQAVVCVSFLSIFIYVFCAAVPAVRHIDRSSKAVSWSIPAKSAILTMVSSVGKEPLLYIVVMLGESPSAAHNLRLEENPCSLIALSM